MPKEPSKAGRSKSAKSSKTSHVLSLLVNDLEQSENPTQTPAPAPEKKPPRAEEKAVASEIRNALEIALEEEAPREPEKRAADPSTAAGTPAVTPEAPQEQEATAASPASATPERAVESEPRESGEQPSAGVAWHPEPYIPEQLKAETPAPKPESVPPKAEPQKSSEDKPICFNVMQALVEAKADKYIQLFGLCRCPRCRIDVVALALTNLPAKYVVTTQTDLIPRLAVYEGHFNAAVVSQVMHACNQVSEKPHHNRKDI